MEIIRQPEYHFHFKVFNFIIFLWLDLTILELLKITKIMWNFVPVPVVQFIVFEMICFTVF